jgi:hypothetical protein
VARGKRNSHLSSPVRARRALPCLETLPVGSERAHGRPMQLPLQPEPSESGSTKPFLGSQLATNTCSCLFRPATCLSYEQMFPSSRTSALVRRTLDALRLTRSFLLLEDDYPVDWEVDWNEPTGATHPHRVSLREGFVRRRPGRPTPTPHFCTSPVSLKEMRRCSRRPASSPESSATLN